MRKTQPGAGSWSPTCQGLNSFARISDAPTITMLVAARMPSIRRTRLRRDAPFDTVCDPPEPESKAGRRRVRVAKRGIAPGFRPSFRCLDNFVPAAQTGRAKAWPFYRNLNACLERCSTDPSKSRGVQMAIYAKLYLPFLMSCCIITAGYALLWISNGGGIDPGSPNARL
jgi:hypothetical protein